MYDEEQLQENGQENTGEEILAIQLTIGGFRDIRVAVLSDIPQSLVSRRLYETIAEQHSEFVVRSRCYVREEVTWIDGKRLHIHGGIELRTELFDEHPFLVIEDLPCSRHGCDVVLGGDDMDHLGAIDEGSGLRFESMVPAVTYPYVFGYVDEGSASGEDEISEAEGEHDDGEYGEGDDSMPFRYRG